MDVETVIPETVIVGAGLAGLTCARTLQAAGRSVAVLDKSRGVGGRLATRRLHGTHADHGFRVWAPQHPELQMLTEALVEAGVLQPWNEGYAAKDGGNAIAKYLARDLTIYRQHRAVKLETAGKRWRIWSTVADATELASVEARQIVLALPAPQAADLLSASGFIEDDIAPLRQVQYAPCVTVMAGYKHPIAGWPNQVQVVPTDRSASKIKHIILDSSKRNQASPRVVVIHSTGPFATRTLSTDRHQLEPVAQDLLQAAATQASGLAQPDWFQVHRWRYALVTTPCPAPIVTLPSALANPVLCCGDWCQPTAAAGLGIDTAYQSGKTAALQVCQFP